MDPKILLAVEEDGKLWTTSEICAILFGLLQVSQAKPLWVRWLWKSWELALSTAISIFAHEALIKYNKKRQQFENLLEDVNA